MGKENASSTELKRDHQCLDEDTEPESLHSKKQAKEVSNEDVRSEEFLSMNMNTSSYKVQN